MGGRAEAPAIALEAQHPHATIVTAYTWSQLPLPGYGTYRVVVDAGAAGRIELPLTVAELTAIAEEAGPAAADPEVLPQHTGPGQAATPPAGS